MTFSLSANIQNYTDALAFFQTKLLLGNWSQLADLGGARRYRIKTPFNTAGLTDEEYMDLIIYDNPTNLTLSAAKGMSAGANDTETPAPNRIVIGSLSFPVIATILVTNSKVVLSLQDSQGVVKSAFLCAVNYQLLDLPGITNPTNLFNLQNNCHLIGDPGNIPGTAFLLYYGDNSNPNQFNSTANVKAVGPDRAIMPNIQNNRYWCSTVFVGKTLAGNFQQSIYGLLDGVVTSNSPVFFNYDICPDQNGAEYRAYRNPSSQTVGIFKT